MNRSRPSYAEENILYKMGFLHIAGVDEVGRGCFAGPLVAAAVILPSSFSQPDKINDSKLVPQKLRETLSDVIKKEAIAYAISQVPAQVIDKVGIAKATQIVFSDAIKSLSFSPDFILIDAFTISSLNKSKQKAIIHGDRISISIAAASIIAKVYRDALMTELHGKYPHYSFNENKGYGTFKHRNALQAYGPCQEHRISFNLQKYTI